MGDSADVKYVPNSYKAVGQDGSHFNMDVNAGSNNSVPATVLGALYAMSDHLPVKAQLRINATPMGVANVSSLYPELLLVNPVVETLDIRLKKDFQKAPFVEIYNLAGQLIYSRQMQSQGSGFNLRDDVSSLAKGTYILSIVGEGGYKANKKIVKY
jgi:hypothetical protein